MPKGIKEVYTPELIEYVKANVEGQSTHDLIENIKKDLGVDETPERIKLIKARYKLRNGIDCQFHKGNIPFNKGQKMPKDVYAKCKETMFKKGSIPPNHKSVGTLFEDKDGYLLIKVKEGTPGHRRRCDLWKPYHRVKWEEYHHQKVPPNHAVIFADGNKRNFDEDNLILVSRGELAVMNKRRRTTNNKDITKTNLLITKIEMKTNKLKEKTND